MDKFRISKGFALIVIALVAFITLGGLGNIAVQDHFYWVAFAANVVVYGCVIYNLLKHKEDE